MRTFAFAAALIATVGIIGGAAAEPRMVLIEEFTNAY
jgi:hypothetical protein